MPTVSILLPTYNGARYLDEQVTSILQQDFDDFELIAIDDGSSDMTPAMLARYAASDARVRVVPSVGNTGQRRRILELLGHATGDLVSIADQDDIWDAARTGRLVAAMGSYPLVMGRSELIDGEGKRIGCSLLELSKIDAAHAGRLEGLTKPRFSAHASLIRRSWLDPATLTYPIPFDWLLGLLATFTDGMAYVDDAVVLHRIHGGNQMNNVYVKGRQPRMTKKFIRWLLLNQRASHVTLWLVMTFLGDSPTLDAETRRTFRFLADRAHVAWLSDWRRPLSSDNGLRAKFELLRPYASSEDDWRQFSRQVEVLTSRLPSRARIGDIIARWRG